MITVYTGCMFAGKTTKLLEKYKEFNRQNSLIVQWSKDTRHSKVQTHDGKYIDYATTIRLNDINDLTLSWHAPSCQGHRLGTYFCSIFIQIIFCA